jgi:hypothetical protein
VDYYIPSFWIALTVLLMSLPIAHYYAAYKTAQKNAEFQKDTISRLINREPVTYQEVNQTPPQPSTERYNAWGNEIVDIRDSD